MYIYKITNTINGKSYIGLKTKTVEESLDYYGSGKLILHAISKYGKENFTKEIIERDITDLKILNEREIYWINFYNLTDRSVGYNITHGGQGFISNHSEESKAKISRSLSGKSYDDIHGENAELERLKRKKCTRTPEEYKISAKKGGLTMKGVPKPFKTVKCPHCSKRGKENIMYRWHFNNCKNKTK